MLHRDRVLANRIVSEIDIAFSMLGNTKRSVFLDNEMLKRAVCMTVINIGELVKGISDETRAEYPQIPWKAIAGIRDITAHKYQTLRMEDVWETVKSDFPELRSNLLQILHNDPSDE